MENTSVRSFLDRLLTEGRAVAQRGEDLAAQRLGIGDDPSARARLRQTGLAGGAALGLLGLLLGQRRRGSLPRNALLIGGIGALGKVAMDAWSAQGGASGRSVTDLDEDAAETHAKTLLFAMVSAAKADGHIDDEEQSAIHAELEDLPEAVKGFLGEAIAAPSNPEVVATRVRNGHEAREVYAASALMCGRDHPQEMDYLDRLARALGISEEEARRIEEDVIAIA
ncbi:tellurite resistance TerB family protein [Rubellimicrobium arenae]|uniref:tellurite resistance TerB family protein n=1 Tax=Rubellimicrobium arenae TaxID=2817372 RepID=UPI001B311EC0|nr:DUF533 domain-containing protein [Rubellimicrobium arenae]